MKHFIILKTDNQGLFITDNVDNKSYFSSEISGLKFDGLKLEPAYKEYWYKLSDIPTRVTKETQPKRINQRYELKKGYPLSSLTPPVILMSDMNSDDEIFGLYQYKFDLEDGKEESIEFEYELIETSFILTDKPKYTYSKFLIDELAYSPFVTDSRPCYISGPDLYKVVRNFIKTNIDGRYAAITSDYDFCFRVEKIIKYAKPKSYTADIGTKRKPNIITKYRQDKKIVIFESAPKEYQNYPKQNGISAANYHELEQKIDSYLNELILEINKPLAECTECQGTGVIVTAGEIKQ